MGLDLGCCPFSCEVNFPAFSKQGMIRDSFRGTELSLLLFCVLFEVGKPGLCMRYTPLLLSPGLPLPYAALLPVLLGLGFSPQQFSWVWGLLEGGLAWSGELIGASCCSHVRDCCRPVSDPCRSPPVSGAVLKLICHAFQCIPVGCFGLFRFSGTSLLASAFSPTYAIPCRSLAVGGLFSHDYSFGCLRIPLSFLSL